MKLDFDLSETDSVGVLPLACSPAQAYKIVHTMSHMKFRKRTDIVDALRLDWKTWTEMVDFAGPAIRGIKLEGGKIGAILNAPNGDPVLAREGDWIVKDARGYAIVRPDDFEAYYEPVIAPSLAAKHCNNCGVSLAVYGGCQECRAIKNVEAT